MNKSILKETDVTHRDGKLEMKIYYTNYVECHWHDEYEFIYVTKGSCRLTVDGNTVCVPKGQAALICGGELHNMVIENEGAYFAIVAHSHICGSECAHLFSGNYPMQRSFTDKSPAEAKVLENLQEIQRVYEERPFAYELRLKSLITDTFGIIFENKLFAEPSSAASPSAQAYEKIIDFIHTNYQQRLTLEMLSKQCNYSKSYIIRLFKQYTGKTPLDYINQYRIFIAQIRLMSTEKSVLEIASECGIENIGHFINLFRRYTGQTPGKWRKQA